MHQLRGVTLGTFIATFLLAPVAIGQTVVAGGNIVNETWTKVGNPYTIQGDIIVPPGAFLHVEEGVEIRVASSDQQASDPDTSRVAISVQGEMVVAGTEAEPVLVHAETGTSDQTWHGLVVENGASKARFEWMTLQHARYGLESDYAGLEVVACELGNNHFQGVELNSGASLFDRVLVRDTYDYGVRVTGGTVTMTNVISRNAFDHGFYLPGGSVTIVNSAAHANSDFGFYVAGATVSIVNSLATENGYGVYRNGGSASVTYSNVWGNSSSDYSGSISQSNNISANPQYTNEAAGDLTLQSSSVCIDAGTDVGAPDHDFANVVRPLNGDGINADEHDIGPYEYVAMPVCGDGQLNGNDACDDGAANGQYGYCNDDCTGPGPYCGDGNHDVAFEECDDGNTTPGDGCDGNCLTETMGTGGAGGGGTGGGMGTGGSGTGGSGTGANGTGGSGTGANGTGGSGMGAGGGQGASGPCVPGEQVSCACPGGGEGVQSCVPEGNGYGACSCDDANDASGDEGGCTMTEGRPEAPSSMAWLALALAGLLWRRRRA
jgi:MYXO-CTERM domain-containing protein